MPDTYPFQLIVGGKGAFVAPSAVFPLPRNGRGVGGEGVG
jgi:hypothetical protein